MNKTVFVIGLFIIASSIIAQDECKDIIYPANESMEIIFGCCIKNVKYGNVVFYKKDGKSAIITAHAINKDGQYIDLKKYKNQLEKSRQDSDGVNYEHDYAHYKETYLSATRQKNAGIFLTILGVFLEGTSLALSASNDSQENEDAYLAVFVGGAIMETVGIPLWISGGVKRANNKKAMQETGKPKSISLKPRLNRIALAINF